MYIICNVGTYNLIYVAMEPHTVFLGIYFDISGYIREFQITFNEVIITVTNPCWVWANA